MSDAIDELVDYQLANPPAQRHADARCWHCGRHWHGLPLTEKVALMYDCGAYDDTYTVKDDDTPIVCRGSDFIGPMPLPRRLFWYAGDGAGSIGWGMDTWMATAWMFGVSATDFLDTDTDEGNICEHCR